MWLREGPLRQFLFTDENRIAREATWPPAGAEAAPVGWVFDVPDPLPAAREIREKGRLRG